MEKAASVYKIWFQTPARKGLLRKTCKWEINLQWLLHDSQDRVTGMNRDSMSLGATETKYQFTFGNYEMYYFFYSLFPT